MDVAKRESTPAPAPPPLLPWSISPTVSYIFAGLCLLVLVGVAFCCYFCRRQRTRRNRGRRGSRPSPRTSRPRSRRASRTVDCTSLRPLHHGDLSTPSSVSSGLARPAVYPIRPSGPPPPPSMRDDSSAHRSAAHLSTTHESPANVYTTFSLVSDVPPSTNAYTAVDPKYLSVASVRVD